MRTGERRRKVKVSYIISPTFFIPEPRRKGKHLWWFRKTSGEEDRKANKEEEAAQKGRLLTRPERNVPYPQTLSAPQQPY